MTITVNDQISGALRLLGQLAEGEIPTASMSQDALSAFNQMLDSWSTEALFIYTTQDQTFTWPANTASRTLGLTGSLTGNRPISIEDSTYFKDDSTGISYPVTIINEAQYNSISLKTTTSSYPQYLWVRMDNPDITLTVYPVPTKALSWHFISATELAQPATLTTALAFPPGYERAFRFNLACELAPEFGLDPPATVQRLAVKALSNIKRINQSDDVMSFPNIFTGRSGSSDIYTGNA